MRYIRYVAEGQSAPRHGVLDSDGAIRELPPAEQGGDDFLALRENGGLKDVDLTRLPFAPEHITPLSPVARPGKIIGVGLNYTEHARECDLAIPTEPTLFIKPTTALCGAHAPLIRPPGSRKLDWEVELGVVIGKRASYVRRERAADHIIGYTLAIDFSERDFQFKRGGQGFKGKSSDSFAPLGPVLVSADAISDPQAITLNLSVNGVTVQSGNTSDMIFPVDELIAYISTFMTLEPGDVILTGTPAGVGMGQRPERYLEDGDRVEAWAEGFGRQNHIVKSHEIPEARA